jgi:cysteine desulfurase / selenocysteine lyase
MGAGEIKDALAEHAINVSVSPPNSTRLDAEERELGEMVRASVHYYNTEDEVERFCATLTDIVARRG